MLKKNIKNLIQDNLESGDNIWSAQKTKEYIELLTTGALLYQGLYNPVTNVPNLTTLPNGVNFGYVFVISQAGTFYGEKVEIGDMIISNQDEPSSLANWDILQTNLDPDTLGLEFFNELDVTPLPNRKFLRVFEFLIIQDNPTTQEYELKIDPTKFSTFNSTEIQDVNGDLRIVNVPNNFAYFDSDGFLSIRKLISAPNKAILSDVNGDVQEVDVINLNETENFIKAVNVTANGELNTLDSFNVARGVLGGFKNTHTIIENKTANAVTISLGTNSGLTDIAHNVNIPANDFVDVPIGKAVYSKTAEQMIWISSNNWNSANLDISISTQKVF